MTGGRFVPPITFCNIFARNLIFSNLADRWSVNWFECVTHATRPININALLISGIFLSRLCGRTKRGAILPPTPAAWLFAVFRFLRSLAATSKFFLKHSDGACFWWILAAPPRLQLQKNATRNNFRAANWRLLPTAACTADWKTRTLSVHTQREGEFDNVAPATAALVINKLMLPRPCPSN